MDELADFGLVSTVPGILIFSASFRFFFSTPAARRAPSGHGRVVVRGGVSAGNGTRSLQPDLVLAGVRARLRDDLDAPGALAIVDRWADSLLADAPTQITPRDVAGARLVKQTVDALLGLAL